MKTLWKQSKKSKIALVVIFVAIGLLAPHNAFAAASDSALWVAFNAWTNLMLVLARLGISISVAFLRIFMEIAAYNGYIDAPPVILGWYMIRDIANMFFIVALLVIAFGTILGLDQYEWKKSLVKLIFSAILINFSRLIIGAAIDAAHIFTITFLNAVEGAAAGNLIGMLDLDKILALKPPAGGGGENLRLDMLAASIMAAVFGLTAAVAVGAYLMVMAARVVTLWVLIILSPLAFVMSAIPQAKSYADQFWQELSKNIIVAPVMVFFLWIAFATLGAGDINNHVGVRDSSAGSSDSQKILQLPAGGSQSVSLAEVTTWENISAFIIAVAFLFIGLMQTQKIGAVGSGMIGGAINFGKNVATIASGYAAGRWVAGKVGRGGERGITGAAGLFGQGLYRVTGLGSRVKRVQNWGLRQWEGFESWRRAPGGKTMKVEKKIDKETGEVKFVPVRDEKTGMVQFEDVKLGAIQKFFQRRVLLDIASEKKMEKTKKFAETRKKLLDKDIKGNPTYFLQRDYEKVDAIDRFEQGKLKRKEARSAAKTEEISGLGELAETRYPRRQIEGVRPLPTKKMTMSEEIQGHKLRAEQIAAELSKGGAAARFKVASSKEGLKFVAGAVAAQRSSRFHEKEFEAKKVGKEGEYLQSEEGKHELELGQKLAHEIALAQAQIKERESVAKQSTVEKLPDLIEGINLAEQGTAAAEAFVKRLKDLNLQKQFKVAADGIRAAARLETVEKRRIALQQLSEQNAFVRALRATQLQGKELEALTLAKTDAEAEASSEFVEKGVRGFSTPSKALVSVSKRSAEDMNSLTNEGQARALSDNLAFVAMQTEGGEKSLEDIQMRANLFGTTSKVNSEAYIDDTIGDIAKQINRLENNEIIDSEEKAKVEALRDIWEKKLGVIERDNYGKAVGYSNERNAAIMQNYSITGGNLDLLKKHKQIEDKMIEIGTDDYEKAGKEALGNDWNKFVEDSRKNDVFMQEAAQSFKSQALASGHRQLGGHQKFDSTLGFHRMSTNVEHRGIMEAEMRKRGSKVGYQYHSLGEINTSNAMLERVDADHYGNTIGQAKKYLEIKSIQDRTRDGLMGYKPSQEALTDKDGYGQLGGSLDNIKERFGGVDNFIKNILVPQLIKGATAFALVAQAKFANVGTQAAEQGIVKVSIEGTDIKANNLDLLITKVVDRVGESLTNKQKEQLEAVQKAARALQIEGEKKRKKKKSETP